MTSPFALQCTMLCARTFSVLCLLGAASSGFSQTAVTNSPTPLSDRIVAYTINAKLDTNKKTLDATETLAYRNTTGQPQTTFPFHLYLNAFRPESTFSLEAHQGGTRGGGEQKYPPEKIGGITIT